MIMDHFSTLIPPFAHPVRHNKNDNFIMYLGEATANAGVYPNLDAAYLLAMATTACCPRARTWSPGSPPRSPRRRGTS